MTDLVAYQPQAQLTESDVLTSILAQSSNLYGKNPVQAVLTQRILLGSDLGQLALKGEQAKLIANISMMKTMFPDDVKAINALDALL